MKSKIKVETDDPQSLLKSITQSISNNKIATWEIDNEHDFVYTANQWRDQAWISHPHLTQTQMTFKIIESKTTPMSATIRGIYLGRFCEMLITHFDSKILEIKICD